MEPQVHVHLHVSDLARSREFYRAFLGTAPAKDELDYVKFLPGFVPLNLALTEGRPATGDGAVSHLGIQVDSSADVLGHLARVKAAGLPVREEMGVNCCHANQDKFWVQDPDGVEWEIYHLNHDLEDEDQPAPARPRLAARSATALPIARTEACCGGSA